MPRVAPLVGRGATRGSREPALCHREANPCLRLRQSSSPPAPHCLLAESSCHRTAIRPSSTTEHEQQHATFGSAQEARYQRFSAALNAARGAFRNDKVVTAQLAKFKRLAARSAKKTAAPKPAGT